MKILYLSSSTIPSHKANSIQVMKMCDAFSSLNHTVTLISKNDHKKEIKLEEDLESFYGIKNRFRIINIESSNKRLFGGLEYGYKVLKQLKKISYSPDLIYGRNLYALIACLKLQKNIIYESHNAPCLGRKQLEGFLFRQPQFTKLVVISQALYNYYSNNFKVFKSNPEKLLLAPSGANYIENKNILHKSINNNKIKIGYAGSLYPGKGIDLIIKLSQLLPQYEFEIAGGSENEIKIWQEIGLPNNLQFKGFISPNKISDFLCSCDILLAPYSEEVYSEHIKRNDLSKWFSPLKLFEYMAAKKPIIASDLPSIREILENNKTAILVDPQNPLKWANSITQLLCKPKLIETLKQNAFENFKSLYSFNTRAKNILESIQPKSSLNHNLSYKKPVVLHIIGDLNMGGAEKTLIRLLPILEKKDFHQFVITLFEPGILTDELKKIGIETYCAFIPKNLFDKKIINIVSLIKYIKQLKPSIIHSWMYHSNNLINIISFLFNNVTLINSIRHENPSIGNIKTIIAAKLNSLLSKITSPNIIYCSNSSLKSHLAIGFNNKNSFIIPNGFSIAKICKEKSKEFIKQSLNIQPNTKIALCVGRYCEEKDYPTLLSTIKIIKESDINILFIFCGKNLSYENQELVKQINDLGISDYIILLGIQKDITTIMSAADFLISSSKTEAFPNVIAESMSVATPCIATNVGETSEIIGNAGFCVSPQNPPKLAQAITEYLSLEEKAQLTLGEKAQQRIINKFSLESSAIKYNDLYSKLLNL